MDLDQEESHFSPTLLGHRPSTMRWAFWTNEALLLLKRKISVKRTVGHNAHARNSSVQNVARADAGELVGVSYHNNQQ